MVIHKIERSNLVENVSEQMYSLIEQGIWKEGMKIASENRLADDFNVSRVVVREALQGLRSRGLIVTRQGLGSFVCRTGEVPDAENQDSERTTLEIDEDDFLSLLELRSCVENRAIQLAVEHGTEEDFQKLHDALKKMRETIGDLDAFTEADFAWHMATIEAGHSKLLIKAYQSCRSELIFVLREMNRVKNAHSYAVSIHQAVYDALIRRDAAEAIKIFKNTDEYNTVRYAAFFKKKGQK